VSRRRVGVNLLWLVPGVVGGSEEYGVRLLEAFADRGAGRPDLDVRLFVNRLTVDEHPGLVERYATTVGPVDGPNRALRVAAESTWLPAETRRQGLDVVHHLGGTMPVVRTAPGIVTVHDLQPFTRPEGFSRAKRAYLRLTVGPSVRRARWVTSLSEWVRDDIVARCGADPARTVVIPPGVDVRPPADPERVADLRRRLGLGDRAFVVYPGITYAHKNHRTLLRALAVLRDQGGPVPLAVLPGGSGDAETDLRDEVDRLGLRDLVRRPGRLPEDDLWLLYGAAAALALPSRYEGFGLPVLEAMSVGCPVLASRVCALPEVVDGGGVLLDPDDPVAWADAIGRVAADPVRRSDLAARGRARAAEFTWDRAADLLDELYRRDLGGGT
jgi:glycosyltransferase involved in cell wall biosynthesis